MKKILAFCISLLLVTTVSAFAENYLLNGGQESEIKYQLEQTLEPAAGTRKLILNYVVPTSFTSSTYNQRITNLNFSFNPQPTERKERNDTRGNKVIEVVWKPPLRPVSATVSLTAKNSVRLDSLNTNAPFPLTAIPSDAQIYLKATKQVSSNDPRIRAKAKELTAFSKTEFDAVQKILTWVVDHMHYVLTPTSYDSLYSFESGKGNCQNYSHLTAALMRAVGIPARIVNGVTLKEPYDINTGNSIMTMKIAQGRHSWIEVFFPDLGWTPFDPQITELFVSNRFIRIEVGLDNDETENDGLLKWTRVKGQEGRPRFEENIAAAFVSDKISLRGTKMKYGPRGMLLSPRVEADFTKINVIPLPPPPPPIPEVKLNKLRYVEPYVFGNLEFPENINFLSVRGPATEDDEGTMKIKKNFLVETAEYVTTMGKQYAQTFILKKPLKLMKVGLALHKFGGDGQMWLELYKDNNGMPGELIATSDMIDISTMKYSVGYAWKDFFFNKSKTILSPGRYWMALGFTGSPIINWFYSYGKPVGPQDGTRYKTMFDTTWSRSLSFEFNYKVVGRAAKYVYVNE